MEINEVYEEHRLNAFGTHRSEEGASERKMQSRVCCIPMRLTLERSRLAIREHTRTRERESEEQREKVNGNQGRAPTSDVINSTTMV